MMLGYATDSLEGTYCLLKLSTNKVVKSRNVHWLDKVYREYIKENARAKQIIDEESDDFENSSEEKSQNQGAGDSEVERDNAPGAGQEGQTE